MRGYRVPRKAGWDSHGLPVELEVEKQLGIAGKEQIEEYGIAEFNAALPRERLHLPQGLGPADRAHRLLDRPRRRLLHADQRLHRVGLVVCCSRIWDKDLLYQGYKVVPYCPRCGTAHLQPRGRAGLQGRRRPVGLRPLPAAPAAAEQLTGAAGRRRSRWPSGPPRPGRCSSNVAVAVQPRRRPTPWSRAAASASILARDLVEKVLGAKARRRARRSPASELLGLDYEAAVPATSSPTGGPTS